MSAFSEDSRVKFPTIKHLMEMGYKYISQNGLESKRYSLDKTNIDPDTNILLNTSIVFTQCLTLYILLLLDHYKMKY